MKKIKLIYIFTIVFLLFLSILMPSCSEKRTKLNYKERISVDTLTQNKIKEIAMELDKICKDSTDKNMQKAKDSLWAYQLSLIDKELKPSNNTPITPTTIAPSNQPINNNK